MKLSDRTGHNLMNLEEDFTNNLQYIKQEDIQIKNKEEFQQILLQQFDFLYYNNRKQTFSCKLCNDSKDSEQIVLHITLFYEENQKCYQLFDEITDIIENHIQTEFHQLISCFQNNEIEEEEFNKELQKLQQDQEDLKKRLLYYDGVFKKEWLKKYKWLDYDVNKKKAFCKVCQDFGNYCNLTKGMVVSKVSSLIDHQNSKGHVTSQQKQDVKLSNNQNQNKQKVDNKSLNYYKDFHTLEIAHLICIELMPFKKFDIICKLTNKSINNLSKTLTGKEISEFHYQSNHGFKLLINSIFDYEKQSMIDEIKRSPYVSFFSDHSKKQSRNLMIQYVKYIDLGKKCTQVKLLSLEPTTDSTSNTIFEQQLKIQEEFEISDLKRISDVSDCCPTYFGSISGVHQLGKSKNPHRLAIKCASHQTNTSYRDTRLECPELNNLILILNQITMYIKGSPQREAQFNEIQNEIYDQIFKLIREPETRWVYLSRVVYRVNILMDSIMNYFKEEANAQQIYQSILNISFHVKVNFLIDLLKNVDNIYNQSQAFFNNPLHFYDNLDETLDLIEQDLDTLRNGDYTNSVQNIMNSVNYQSGHEIISDKNKSTLIQECIQIGSRFKTNIEERFEGEFLRNFSIFCPQKIKNTPSHNIINKFQLKLTNLWRHYGKSKKINNFQQQPIIDITNNALLNQYIQAVETIKVNYKEVESSTFIWCDLYQKSVLEQCNLKELCQLAIIGLVCPISNSISEHGFSVAKYILNEYRSQMGDKMLNKIMFITMNTKKYEDQQKKDCYDIFKTRYQKQWNNQNFFANQ